MKRKLIATIFTIAMMCSVVACSKKEATSESVEKTNSTTTVANDEKETTFEKDNNTTELESNEESASKNDESIKDSSTNATEVSSEPTEATTTKKQEPTTKKQETTTKKQEVTTTKKQETTTKKQEVTTTKKEETTTQNVVSSEYPKTMYCKHDLRIVDEEGGTYATYAPICVTSENPVLEITVLEKCKTENWYKVSYQASYANIVGYINEKFLLDSPDSLLEVPADYSPTAVYDYNDGLVQQSILNGYPYPTVDYNTVPVVDIDSMITYDKMGPNCSGFSNLSKPWHYEYNAYNVDTLPYFTWNEEIPMNQYIIWGDKLGFFYKCDYDKVYGNYAKNEVFQKLFTTDFDLYDEDGGEIQFGGWTDWGEDEHFYRFVYIKNWK